MDQAIILRKVIIIILLSCDQGDKINVIEMCLILDTDYITEQLWICVSCARSNLDMRKGES